jgi:hypothetical protein
MEYRQYVQDWEQALPIPSVNRGSRSYESLWRSKHGIEMEYRWNNYRTNMSRFRAVVTVRVPERGRGTSYIYCYCYCTSSSLML